MASTRRIEVPIKPTDDMIIAGLRAIEQVSGTVRQVEACWVAMIKASKKVDNGLN